MATDTTKLYQTLPSKGLKNNVVEDAVSFGLRYINVDLK